MAVYSNNPEQQPIIETKTNGHVTESRISMDVHPGTHIDAPLHISGTDASPARVVLLKSSPV